VQAREAARQPLQAALKAEPAVREAALRDLVGTAEPEIATEALIQLIRLHATNLEALALGLVPRLSDVGMGQILGAAETRRDLHLRMAMARRVLQRFATNPPAPRLDNDGVGAAGTAAVLLSDSRDASDRILIGRVLRTKPRESGLWMAVA